MKFLFGLLVLLIWLLPGAAGAQFLSVQLEIPAEVETLVDRPLQFGTVISGGGLRRIPLGSQDMGVFRLRILNTQQIIIELQPSEEFTSTSPNSTSAIPFQMDAAVTVGVNNYRQSRPLHPGQNMVAIEQPAQLRNPEWINAFVYIFGAIEVGDIPEGVYTGEIVLTVFYE
ncbi:MAG: hypothetical protein ACNA78_02990 [Balneolaceae bacterium]